MDITNFNDIILYLWLFFSYLSSPVCYYYINVKVLSIFFEIENLYFTTLIVVIKGLRYWIIDKIFYLSTHFGFYLNIGKNIVILGTGRAGLNWMTSNLLSRRDLKNEALKNIFFLVKLGNNKKFRSSHPQKFFYLLGFFGGNKIKQEL